MKVVKNTRPYVHVVGALVLMPNANVLDTPEKESAWAKAKKIALVQTSLEKGDLVEEGFEAESPAELTLDQVLSIVTETLDVEVLESMYATETRPQVLAVIEAQLAKLGPTDEQKKSMAEQAERDRKAAAAAKAESVAQ